MAYTTIDKPTDYFNTVTYAGNGSSPRSITGVGFQPDWVWTKNRSAANSNTVGDSVRGTGKTIFTDSTSAELTNNGYGYHSSFDADGFAVTGDTVSAGGDNVNKSGNNYVSWNWLASGSTASNSNGSITSTVSANTTAGFSIVSYTGTGSNATVGHGLSSPKMILVKNRDTTNGWEVFHASLGATKVILLDRNEAEQTSSSSWNNTAPTSSVFSIGTAAGTNGSSNDLIAYCFAEKKGYSKFGSYTGNGNADGTFVYTGFRPAWLMYKRTDTTGSWEMWDNKRSTFNPENKALFANASDAEATASNLDFTSNGFKIRVSSNGINASGASYIYLAFAENPFVNSNGVPTNAR